LLRLNKSWWGDLAALDKLIPLELKIASAELIIFLNEVGLDALDAEVLDGLAYHLKNKPATKLSLDDLRERGHYCHLLGGLGETHPILHQLNKEWWTEQPIAAIKAFDNSFYNKHLIDFLNKIGPKQFTDEVQTKLAGWDKQKAIHVSLAKKDRNNQPQGIEIANNNNKELGANQAVYSKVEAAKKGMMLIINPDGMIYRG